MEAENKNKKRPQVKALYCAEATADAVNNHEWFSNCITGEDRAAKMLEALDFASKWKGHVESAAPSDELLQQVEDLKQQLSEAISQRDSERVSFDESYTQRGNILEEKQEEILQLKKQMEGMTSGEVVEDMRRELEEANERILALQSETVNWEKISTVLDPAYVAVIEEITNRLIAKFHLPSLEPQVVLVTFFMKYYFNQEVEFSGMPFIIKPKEILEIVQTVYPEMEKNTLKKALSVK